MSAPHDRRSDPEARFLGRRREMRVVERVLRNAKAGQGSVAILEGPAGIGKSRLLAEVSALASAQGIRPLLGESFDGQQTVPLAPLLAATLGARPPIGDAAAIRVNADRDDLRYWVVRDLQAALEEASASAPLVVLLDDLHWADQATSGAIRALTRSLAGEAIGWILAARTEEAPQSIRDAFDRLAANGAARLELAPLTRQDSATLVNEFFDARAEPALLDLADQAGGNPFLLLEIMSGLREENRVRIENGQAVLTGDAVPRRLAESMTERLNRLDDRTRQVVLVASVLPHRFTAAQLAAVARLSAAQLLQPLGVALNTQLFGSDGDGLRFRHDLLREAARASLPPSLRRAMEREAAGVLLASGAAPKEVALLLVQSADAGDRMAVAALREAAATVAATDAEVAASLATHALRLLPRHAPERGALVSEAVVHLHRAQRFREAHELADAELTALLTAEQEAEMRLRVSAMPNGLPLARARENETALQLTGISDRLRGMHQAYLAYNLMQAGRAAQAAAAAARARRYGDELGDPLIKVYALAVLASCAYATGAFVQCLQLTDELRALTAKLRHDPSARDTYLVTAMLHQVNLLWMLGRDAAARSAFAACRALVDRQGSGGLEALWIQMSGLFNYSSGQLADALADSRAAEALNPDIGLGRFGAILRMMTVSAVAARTGDPRARHEAELAAKVDVADDVRVSSTWENRVRALTAWRDGGLGAAARLLGNDPLLASVPPLPVDQEFWVAGARIALASGDQDLTARVAALADQLLGAGPEEHLLYGIGLHVHGLLGHDPDELSRAAATLRDQGRPLLWADAARDAGEALLTAGRTEPATAQLDSAVHTYLAHGALADARLANNSLRKLGAARRISPAPRPQRGWDSLTKSEQKVAELIAAGLTNREAAQTLFISPHTVSSHLRAAFEKLGVHSRVQLTRLLADGEGRAPASRLLFGRRGARMPRSPGPAAASGRSPPPASRWPGHSGRW